MEMPILHDLSEDEDFPSILRKVLLFSPLNI